jgi:hypothetical protein
VSILLRHRFAFVAQDSPQCIEIATIHHPLRRERVAQVVEVEID